MTQKITIGAPIAARKSTTIKSMLRGLKAGEQVAVILTKSRNGSPRVESAVMGQ